MGEDFPNGTDVFHINVVRTEDEAIAPKSARCGRFSAVVVPEARLPLGREQGPLPLELPPPGELRAFWSRSPPSIENF